jgi:hypothetical protein
MLKGSGAWSLDRLIAGDASNNSYQVNREPTVLRAA